jgi:hypothetical protein
MFRGPSSPGTRIARRNNRVRRTNRVRRNNLVGRRNNRVRRNNLVGRRNNRVCRPTRGRLSPVRRRTLWNKPRPPGYLHRRR